MSVFAIADLHLSLSDSKPMDVFEGWRNYLERLQNNWQKLVAEDDTVVIPGDISWAMSLSGAERDFAFLNSLPGKKLLLKGNHDYWWSTASKMRNFFAQCGFGSLSIVHNCAAVAGNIAVCGSRGWFNDTSGDKKVLLREAGRLSASICEAEKTGLEPVVFLHYPPVCSSFFCPEILDVLRQHAIKRCYYGHLHGKATSFAVEGERDGTVFRLVSADHLGFCPLLIER